LLGLDQTDHDQTRPHRRGEAKSKRLDLAFWFWWPSSDDRPTDDIDRRRRELGFEDGGEICTYCNELGVHCTVSVQHLDSKYCLCTAVECTVLYFTLQYSTVLYCSSIVEETRRLAMNLPSNERWSSISGRQQSTVLQLLYEGEVFPPKSKNGGNPV
jgi:hypothetical protein